MIWGQMVGEEAVKERDEAWDGRTDEANVVETKQRNDRTQQAQPIITFLQLYLIPPMAMFVQLTLAFLLLAFFLAKCVAMVQRNPSDYDQSRVPPNLRPISWLLGIWRSEHDGKAMFPTIPKFTYGEEISIALSDSRMGALPAFNYTAFAWSAHDQDELHSENGYITVSGSKVMLTTVMNNGFVTVEEGPVSNSQLRFKLVDIGRISFSRDLPVHDLVREWTLLDHRHFEARLDMETLTHGMQEHTVIVYTKVL